VVGADEMAQKYGCDTARMYTLFAAPPAKDLEWSEDGIEGCSRFLNKVYRLVDRHAPDLRSVDSQLSESIDLSQATAKEKLLLRKAHQTLKRVTHDFEVRWHFNSSIALVMEYYNEIHAQEPLDQGTRPQIAKRLVELLVLMLTPITPHICEELWEMLGHADGLGRVSWPAFRDDLAKEEQFEVVIQINGRVRGKILVDDGLSESETRERGLSDPRISQLVQGRAIAKIIVVPRKLVNIVLR
ncbi:MAG: class I tRNA ligase family protein, partial [Candidatus Acidiferrales bacterium]